MAARYPNEVLEFIKEQVIGRTGRTNLELANLVNERFGTEFTASKMASYKSYHKICQPSKYPEGMENYIRRIAAGKTAVELAEAVSRQFGIKFSVSQCKAYKKNHGIVTGVDCRFQKGHVPANKGKNMSPEKYEKCKATMFQKGQIPANHMKVGAYTHSTDGYLLQKVKEDGTQRKRFELMHRKVWEEHNGLIPKGKKVSFLDGNKDNCDIANLVLIDNRENLELNRSHLRFAEAELTQVGVSIAKVRVAARRKRYGYQTEKGEGNDEKS